MSRPSRSGADGRPDWPSTAGASPPYDEVDLIVEGDLPERQTHSRRTGGQPNLLALAMLAVGEIIEPEKTTVNIEQESSDDGDDLPFSLDFGDLPPLN